LDTKSLAKNYSLLTPAERLPLYMHAAARGDEQEKNRIADCGKMVSIQVNDTFTLAMALREVSDRFFMETFNVVLMYLTSWHAAPAKKFEDEFEQMRRAMFYGYMVKTYITGWRLFAAEHGIPADAHWKLLPGYDFTVIAERAAETFAFEPEGFVRYLLQHSEQPNDESLPECPLTPTAIAKALNLVLADCNKWWGVQGGSDTKIAG